MHSHEHGYELNNPAVSSFAASTSSPWFAVSMGLMGIIIGYVIGVAEVPLAPGRGTVAQNPGIPSIPPAPPTPPPQAPAPAGPVPEVTGADHVRGNRNAKISIIEYSDFECPFCKRHHPTLKQLLTRYGDDVNIVYRHFPLSFHPFAQKAAEASECVAEQKGDTGFWDFNDYIFEAADALSDDQILQAAKAAGVNEKTFKNCQSSGKYTQKVQEQYTSGSTAGVSGTPGNFVINNETDDKRQIDGAVPESEFVRVIDEMLNS